MKRSYAGVEAEVARKRIKHMYIRVKPDGVYVSAPLHVSEMQIAAFVRERQVWIEKQRQTVGEVGTPAFLDGETHYLWGKPCALRLVTGRPSVVVCGNQLLLSAGKNADAGRLRVVMNDWRKQLLLAAVPSLLAKWCPVIGVEAPVFSVRSMKSRWGSCSAGKGRITLNSLLTRKVPRCLEYVVVHELVHLLERGHGTAFKKHMDALLPDWRQIRRRLGQSDDASVGL